MNSSNPNHQPSDPVSWVDRYGDYLYAFALSRVRDPSVAEEMVQEALLAALGARKNFKKHSSEKTWLTGILKHKIMDYYRKQSREKTICESILPKHRLRHSLPKTANGVKNRFTGRLIPMSFTSRRSFWRSFITV